MALELVYTSAPKGLRQGSSGYCTVACTRGMPPNYIDLLESLSGYKPVFAAGDAMAAKNPVACSHYRVYVGGKGMSVLSRVCFAGFDHTGRTNKLAHHLLVDSEEQVAAGPFALASDEGLFLSHWAGEPRQYDAPKRLPSTPSPSVPARLWERLTGDAGWAGVLAGSFDGPASRPAWLVFEPGMDVIGLLREAAALLPPEMRWQVTFNTYLTSLPASTTCHWRCVLADSPLLKEAQRTRAGLVIDLRLGRGLGRAPADGVLVETARTGRSLPPVRVAPGPSPSISPRSPRAPAPPVTPLPPPAHEAEPEFSAPPRAGRWVVVLACLLVVAAGVAVVQTARLSDDGTRSVRQARDLEHTTADLAEQKARAEELGGQVTQLQEDVQAARGSLEGARRELSDRSETLKEARARVAALEQDVARLKRDLASAHVEPTAPSQTPEEPEPQDPPSGQPPHEEQPSETWVFRMDGLRGESIDIQGVTVGMSMSIVVETGGKCTSNGWTVYGPNASGGNLEYTTLISKPDGLTLSFQAGTEEKKRLCREVRAIIWKGDVATIRCNLLPIDRGPAETLMWPRGESTLDLPTPLPWDGKVVKDPLECSPVDPVEGVKLVPELAPLREGKLKFGILEDATARKKLERCRTLDRLRTVKDELKDELKAASESTEKLKKLVEREFRADEVEALSKDVSQRWENAVKRFHEEFGDGDHGEEELRFGSLDGMLKEDPSDKDARKKWMQKVASTVNGAAKSFLKQVGDLRQQLEKEIKSLEAFKHDLEKPQTIEVKVGGKPVYICRIALKLD